MKRKREFCVDTPLGTLHVYAEHSITNSPGYYPGVYVELVRIGRDPEILACVEFDSYEDDLLTTVYDTGDDQPKCYYHHQAGLEDGEDGQ